MLYLLDLLMAIGMGQSMLLMRETHVGRRFIYVVDITITLSTSAWVLILFLFGFAERLFEFWTLAFFCTAFLNFEYFLGAGKSLSSKTFGGVDVDIVSLCNCYVSFGGNFGIWRNFFHVSNLNVGTNLILTIKMFLIDRSNFKEYLTDHTKYFRELNNKLILSIFDLCKKILPFSKCNWNINNLKR